MTKDELKYKYLKWMTRLVSDESIYPNGLFNNLISHLHNIEFRYILERDANRTQDGIDLRYRFAYENDIDPFLIDEYLLSDHCSVLEMMIALANRCEESIMDNPSMGNRQSKWFRAMVYSLGLSSMHDYEFFDSEFVDEKINKFMNRDYKTNGSGGLFTVKNPPRDMRDVEIWYQMCWYIDDIIEQEEGGEYDV